MAVLPAVTVWLVGWVTITGAIGVGSGKGSCETVPPAETRKARTPWALAWNVLPLATVMVVSAPETTAVTLQPALALRSGSTTRLTAVDTLKDNGSVGAVPVFEKSVHRPEPSG